MDHNLSEILGKIILIQSTLHVMDNDASRAKFACRGFSQISCMERVGMYLGGNFYCENDHFRITTNDCRLLLDRLSADSPTSRYNAHEAIVLSFEKKFNVHCLMIATGFNIYGFLFVQADKGENGDGFQSIRPYVENTLNILALIIENNIQKNLLQNSKADLEQQVAERTRELTQANQDLEDRIIERARMEEALRQQEALYHEQLLQAMKMDSIGKLAGGVAHDFNNMIMVILGNAEIALEEVDESHTIYQNLMEILNSAKRSAELTRQLLAFARKQAISPKILGLNDLVTGMVKMLQRLIGENIELKLNLSSGLWPIKMDPTQIDQILVNLTVNARDAINGEGRMVIETMNVRVDETLILSEADASPGDYVMLAVSDSGCGIDKENLPHLFEPFFTTKELGKGTGMGLATVYGIIKQNNGFINIYSEPGQGTTFRIYLPCSQPLTDDVSEPRSNKPPRGNETILLVEDEAPILLLGKKILERHGYTVITAQTPLEALSLVENHNGVIHLLITDVVMPAMNGKILCEKIRELRPGIKTLFMSGYTSDIIAHHGILDEGIRFLEKPFSVKTLATKTREILDAAVG